MRTPGRVPARQVARSRRWTIGGLLVAWLAAVLLVPDVALAQGVTGTVVGTVQDIQGGVVPGATVTMISESQGTRMVPVVTNATGDFVVPNVTADTYTVRVELPSFRTLNRTGVAVPPGSRISVGRLTLQVGGATEVVNVTSEAPLIQATTGERSFSVSTDTVLNLPLASRSYDSLLGLAPGIQTQDGLTFASRLGGGGGSNFMLDGATAMDPGINRAAGKVSIEAIQEVKVATSGYQAEYGRSSGLQINAVTKSGTNRFHGSLYDAERRTWMNAMSEENKLLEEPKDIIDQRDWGFTIGGPVGRPGGDNKLFFFFNYERNPRTRSADTINYRMPTPLERKGDFSQTLDNQGRPYPFIKDPLVNGACNASSQVACFQDGGVVGRIPQNRLYGPGLAILNWYPEPNRPLTGPFNYQTDPYSVALLGYQPVIRGDWQPTPNLRVTFKYFMYQQPNDPIRGTIPGWNDTREDDYGIYTPSGAVNYTLNATTFFEASWGGNYHHQEGCSVNGGEPNFCRNALQMSPAGNRNLSGFGNLPQIFPDAMVIDPETRSYEILNNHGDSSVWDGTRVSSVPSFTWGGRVANSPPNNIGPFGNFILDTQTSNINVSLTKVAGAHNFKFGYYYYMSNQRRGTGNMVGSISFQNDTANAIDTSFPFANAAVGVFNQYTQTSRWAEGAYIAINHEWYAQDNWKIGRGLTLDYGVRLVNQIPQSDGYDKNAAFLPDRWVRASAPRIYVGTCAQPVTTSNCSAANLRATDPGTGETISKNASLLIGTVVPNSGDNLNGIVIPGEDGINEHGYSWPTLAIAPRTGIAWDVKGDQRFVVRGGAGLFYDRPASNTTYSTVQNPPYTTNATLRYGTLQDLGSAVAPAATPSLSIFQYELPLPSSSQWNGGIQFAAPFNMAVDVAYSGQHSWNGVQGIQINNFDLGMAYDPKFQDPTRAAVTPVNSLVNTNPASVRAYQGYANISQTQPYNWRTYHSIQLSVNRRMSNGFQFSFADTIGLSDKASATARMEHLSDGTAVLRSDQARADELLGDQNPRAHFMKGSWVWQIPNREMPDSGFGKVMALLANDWSLSGVWNGETGTKYSVSPTYASGNAQSALNLTGSPNYTARAVLLKQDNLGGCSSNVLRQFDTTAFMGPAANSDGLESGNGYLTGCFISSTDVALARTIQLGGGRSVQFRFDVFNLFNQHAITDRETSFELANTNESSRTAILNLPYDANGNVIPDRALPNGDAGFGVATEYQEPRTMQIQVRFAF